MIEPLDTLFFRDGRPFNMGDETWAEGMFPPNPSVIYGALRSAYFSLYPDEFQYAGTENDPSNNIAITDIYFCELSDKNEKYFYYLTPADILKPKNKKSGNYDYQLISSKNTSLENKIKNIPLYNISENLIRLENTFITRRTFLKYIQASNKEKVETESINSFISNEPKIGIGRERTKHAAKDGMLYRTNMIRTANKSKSDRKLHFVITYNFEGDKEFIIPDTTLLKLGGEGKVININSINPQSDILLSENFSSKYIKFYLKTPLITNDLIPKKIYEYINEYLKVEVENITPITYKPIYIGGFDLKNKKPKTMYKAYPSGSIFIVETKEKVTYTNKIFKECINHSLSEKREKEGYGLFQLAKFGENNE
ncbi:MAG: type III-B CRISPR module-associated protein Cmr3 [Leptospiraceae bacterium]|nr:type III-B CRISPR module-associated protein Cmr3 [Leptospiraceae bacterium]